MFNKKAMTPVMKTLAIIITTGTIIVFFLVVFSQAGVSIDDKKLKTQLVLNKLLHSDCIFDPDGFITMDSFTQTRLDKCFENSDTDLNFLVYITDPNYVEIPMSLYLQNREAEFSQKRNLCNLNSNLLCTELRYPVIVKYKENNEILSILAVQIIVQ